MASCRAPGRREHMAETTTRVSAGCRGYASVGSTACVTARSVYRLCECTMRPVRVRAWRSSEVCCWWHERGLAGYKKVVVMCAPPTGREGGPIDPRRRTKRTLRVKNVWMVFSRSRCFTCYNSGPWQVPLALAGALVAVYWPTGLRIDRRIPASGQWQGLLRISALQRRRRVPLAHAGLLIAVHHSTALRVDLRIPAWWQVLLRISAWVDRALVGLLIAVALLTAIVLRIPARLLQQQVRGTRVHCLCCGHRLPLHRWPRDREGASGERRKRKHCAKLLIKT